MSEIIRVLSPKARFLENPQNPTKHRDLLEVPQLQKSLDAAMLQYEAVLCANMGSNMEAASSVGLRILGAHEFLNIFRVLAETPVEGTSRVPQNANLNHKA